MANQVAHDLMCTLWEETAEATGMKMSLSKDLEIYVKSNNGNETHISVTRVNGPDERSEVFIYRKSLCLCSERHYL